MWHQCVCYTLRKQQTCTKPKRCFTEANIVSVQNKVILDFHVSWFKICLKTTCWCEALCGICFMWNINSRQLLSVCTKFVCARLIKISANYLCKIAHWKNPNLLFFFHITCKNKLVCYCNNWYPLLKRSWANIQYCS